MLNVIVKLDAGRFKRRVLLYLFEKGLGGPGDKPAVHKSIHDGSGMAIIRAKSYDEAVAISEAEPFHVAGVRKNEVQGWVLNEANLQISLKLMNQEISVG